MVVGVDKKGRKKEKEGRGFGRLPSFFFPPFLFFSKFFFVLVILVQIWLFFCYFEDSITLESLKFLIVINKCVRCYCANPSTVEYKMGDLPKVRVTKAKPFSNVGIDYCGPFFINEKKHRNQNKVKVYVSVFVCLVVKAIHLEVVSDLTTDGFIAALKRFTSRRGNSKSIFSDNGTNFVGANNQLKELVALFNSNEHQ